MAAPRTDLSGEIIADRSFRGEDMRTAQFRRAALTDCSFIDCDLSLADFRGATLVRCIFVGCQFEAPEFRDATLTHCNIEVLDGRIAGRGYMVVASPEGLSIGCASFTWDRAKRMSQRDLIEMDKRDAVLWWAVFGPRIVAIGEGRKWL